MPELPKLSERFLSELVVVSQPLRSSRKPSSLAVQLQSSRQPSNKLPMLSMLSMLSERSLVELAMLTRGAFARPMAITASCSHSATTPPPAAC